MNAKVILAWSTRHWTISMRSCRFLLLAALLSSLLIPQAAHVAEATVAFRHAAYGQDGPTTFNTTVTRTVNTTTTRTTTATTVTTLTLTYLTPITIGILSFTTITTTLIGTRVIVLTDYTTSTISTATSTTSTYSTATSTTSTYRTTTTETDTVRTTSTESTKTSTTTTAILTEAAQFWFVYPLYALVAVCVLGLIAMVAALVRRAMYPPWMLPPKKAEEEKK